MSDVGVVSHQTVTLSMVFMGVGNISVGFIGTSIDGDVLGLGSLESTKARGLLVFFNRSGLSSLLSTHTQTALRDSRQRSLPPM